ncbi:hypothetical protein OAG51_01215 [Pirellulaceae bacterium]|nr:hypothetical protein [Pirellulaceae bacterium]
MIVCQSLERSPSAVFLSDHPVRGKKPEMMSDTWTSVSGGKELKDAVNDRAGRCPRDG